MRLISFAFTPEQLLNGTKTVTRRVGWANLKAGERLSAVRKAMGLKKGESPEVLCTIEIVSVRRERLDAIDAADCAAEGFPHLTPAQFVEMFCAHHSIAEPDAATWANGKWVQHRRKMLPSDVVTRIEFRVVPGSIRVAVQERLAV